MNLKNKMKNYGFWVSLGGAVVLLLQAIGFNVDIAYADSIITALCSLLVVLGIISDGDKGKGYIDKKK